MNRRKFLKAIGACCASCAFPSVSNAGLFDSVLGDIGGSMANIIAAAHFNDLELEYLVSSPTPLGKVVVNHFLPVAFIEVINSPVDSLIIPTGALSSVYDALSVGQTTISQKGGAHSFNVRIWNVPGFVRYNMLTPYCKYCSDESALFAPEQDITSIASTISQAACFGSSALRAGLQKMQDKLMAMSPFGCMPTVYYDSSLDPNWANNCHDMAVTASMAASLGLNWEASCNTGLGSRLVQSIAGRFGLSAGDSINPCIGSWGTLFPRQAWVDEANPHMAAAITAYRALHLSAYYYGSFPYLTNLTGKFKMVYPTTSGMAFQVGGAESKAAAEALPISPVENLKYGFVYLAPVTCLKWPTSVVGACAPLPTCGPDFIN